MQADTVDFLCTINTTIILQHLSAPDKDESRIITPPIPRKPAILVRMKLFARKAPWYAAGLAFECRQCGRCCAGPDEGYVWVTRAQIAAIAEYLGITEGQMRRRYVRRVATRYSLKEQPETNDCIFLQPNDHGGRGCAIYPVRPTQCRTWPFWTTNLVNSEAWADAQQRCRGINRGPLHERDEIDTKRHGTCD